MVLLCILKFVQFFFCESSLAQVMILQKVNKKEREQGYYRK